MNSGCDLVDVVADDAESDVLRVLLYHTSEGRLRRLSHHIRLTKDDELEALGEECPGLCELLYLLADDVDATIIGCVELPDKSDDDDIVSKSKYTSRICFR